MVLVVSGEGLSWGWLTDMKCYHDMIRGFRDCPETRCFVGYKVFGDKCTLSEVHWLPEQIKAVANEISELEFKRRGFEERLREVLGEVEDR